MLTNDDFKRLNKSLDERFAKQKKVLTSDLTKSLVPEIKKQVVPEVKRQLVPEIKRQVSDALNNTIPKIVNKTSNKTIIQLIPQLKTTVSLVIHKQMSEQEARYEKKLENFRDEFYTRVDPVLKEVVLSQEERLLTANKLSEHTDQLEILQKIHPKGTHSLAF